MGFGAVFATIMFVFIFASVVVFAVSIQRNIQEAATEQQSRYTSNLKNSKASIKIDSASYSYAPVIQWTDKLYRDFVQGTNSNTVVNSSGVLLTGTPYASGTYTSQAIDTGFSSTNFTTISWTSVEPAGTDIKFQVRSENSTIALTSAGFSGPDGTAGTYYGLSGGLLNSTISYNRYFQYRAYLNTADNTKTPELHAVQVGMQRLVGHIIVNVTNDGALALDPLQTDVYAPTRIIRNSTLRTITVDDVKNQAFFDPGEHMQIVLFKTLTSGETVTVANMAATTSTTVSP